MTTYKYPGSASYGNTASGDSIYALGSKSGYTAIIYSAKSGNRAFKYGFVKTGDYNSIITTATSPSKTDINSNATGSYATYTGIDYTQQTSDTRRIAALRKAQKMVTIKWVCPTDFVTWSSKNGTYNTVTAEDGTKSTKFIKGKTYVGIPYSMINHSYDDNSWISFIKNSVSAKMMESTMSKYPKKGTAKGSDCSYFVYLCLKAGGANVTYQNTSGMLSSKYYKKINKADMKPGDVLLKSGHVMLVAGKSGNNYAVFEATAEGSKTRYKVYKPSDVSAYSAYKYVGW